MTQSTTNIHRTDLDSETYRSQAPDPVGDQAHQMPGSDRSLALLFVRYVVPALLVCSAFVLFAFEPNETGLEGWAMLMGSGLSVALVNALYRLGVSGEAERAAEEAARAFLDEHGYWPDEAPAADVA
jgi:hypothetical protein